MSSPAVTAATASCSAQRQRSITSPTSEADVLELFSQAWAIEGTPTGEDLDDFLQFVFDGTDTTLNVDVDGASEFGSPEIQVALLGVDLVGAASSQAEVIDGLLGGNQLELV